MDKLGQALAALHDADREAGRRSRSDPIHAVARLAVCLGFVGVTVSFGKYDLPGTLGMALYPVLAFIWEEVSLKRAFRRLRYLFGILLLVGVANPFFDRTPLFRLGTLQVTGGMLSMVTLFVKGTLCVLASYHLLVTAGMERICRGCAAVGCPPVMTNVFLLTYRYLILLIKETRKLLQAYALRARKARGVSFRAWGPFAGALLLRSVDRAQDVYAGMLLRGYAPERAFSGGMGEENRSAFRSALFIAGWFAVFLFMRFVPLFRITGRYILGIA